MNTGRFTRITTTGTTVTIVVTAPDRGECSAAVLAGTVSYLIALGDKATTLPPVDLPGLDGIYVLGPSVRGLPYYPEIPPDALSPVTKTAPLAEGHYTVGTYCEEFTATGEIDYNSDIVNKYYLDEFTIAAAPPPPSNPIRFGSS